MPEFSLSHKVKSTVRVNRKQVFWMIHFKLSESQLDKIPQVDLPWLDGKLLYGFYADPLVGDELEIKGKVLRVTKRRMLPTKRNSRDLKVVGIVEVELVR